MTNGGNNYRKQSRQRKKACNLCREKNLVIRSRSNYKRMPNGILKKYCYSMLDRTTIYVGLEISYKFYDNITGSLK